MAFQKVFDFKEVTLEYRSNGNATFNFATDFPGGAMAARLPLSGGGAGVTIATSGGITLTKTVTIPLDGLQGTMFQPSVTPANGVQFILLSAKLWLRPIGVYLDGSITPAEQWITQPIAVGA